MTSNSIADGVFFKEFNDKGAVKTERQLNNTEKIITH
jgi:hypothetical protein